MCCNITKHRNYIRVLKKNELAISVVIGKRTEWLWPNCNLGVQLTR